MDWMSEGIDFTTATYADGPMLAAWIKRDGIGPHEGHYHRDDFCRAVLRWGEGQRASIVSVDFHLTRLGRHISEVPDECWRDGRFIGREQTPEYEEIRRNAEKLIEQGFGDRTIAARLAIAKTTVRKWRNRMPVAA